MGCNIIKYRKGIPIYKPITPWVGSWAQKEQAKQESRGESCRV